MDISPETSRIELCSSTLSNCPVTTTFSWCTPDLEKPCAYLPFSRYQTYKPVTQLSKAVACTPQSGETAVSIGPLPLGTKMHGPDPETKKDPRRYWNRRVAHARRVVGAPHEV